MKSQISEPERAFILEGFRLNTCRRDGRGLLDYRNFKLQIGAVSHGFFIIGVWRRRNLNNLFNKS